MKGSHLQLFLKLSLTFSAAKALGFTEQGIGKAYRSKKSSVKNSSGKYDSNGYNRRNLNRNPVLNLNLAQHQRETLNWDR